MAQRWRNFVAANEDMQLFSDFNAEKEGGVRIYTPTAEYLFAMKCMAMRPESEDGSHDISDIEFLARAAGIQDAETALELIASFYPSARIPPKVAFGVHEIMERLATAGKP